MGWVARTLESTVGMKWMMAITGLGLFAFVLGHMIGNLLVFVGPEALNSYAQALADSPVLLWIARILLIVGVILHILSAVRLTLLNGRARPVAYKVRRPVVSTYASRTMYMGGIILFVFIVYHLAHFTFGYTHPEHYALRDAQGRHDVYAMVVLGFREPLISALYILAMIPLALHLQHGVSSALQTLGLNHPRLDPFLRAVGPVIGTIIFIGNVSMPLLVMAGFVPYPHPAAAAQLEGGVL